MTKLPLHRIWTREQVLALPDDGYRYELIDGRLYVTPYERADHQRLLMSLVRLLDPYVERNAIGELLPGPADLDLFAGHLLQPDLFVIPIRNGHRFSDWPDAGIPWLVVEITSWRSARADGSYKRWLYQEAGVPTYWLVDHEERRIEVWTPEDAEPRVETKRLAWQPLESLAPLEIDIPALYASIWNAP